MIIEALILTMIVICIWYTMQEGEIFGFVGNWLSNHIPHYSHPAVFECNVCMTPWYGTAIYWTFPWHKVSLPVSSFVSWIVVIFVAMGFQIVINKFGSQQEKVEITGVSDKVADTIKDITESKDSWLNY